MVGTVNGIRSILTGISCVPESGPQKAASGLRSVEPAVRLVAHTGLPRRLGASYGYRSPRTS